MEGYALAGGFEIALACDLVVASEEAQFGLPEVKRGLVAGAGGLLRLPRYIPYHLAMEIALTGDRFSAARLHAAGLVSRVVPAGEALAAARSSLAQIAKNAPLALAATKQIVVESADWPQAEAFERQGDPRPGVLLRRRVRGSHGVRAEARARLAWRVRRCWWR